MSETIAAVSTAYGEGGIGIVRISGEKAGEILVRLFVRPGDDTGMNTGDDNGTTSDDDTGMNTGDDNGMNPDDDVKDIGCVKTGKSPDSIIITDFETDNDIRSPEYGKIDNLRRAEGIPGGAGFAHRHMYYGHIIDPNAGEVIDEVLAVMMYAPNTYTGEDLAEIHCHGSTVSLRNILGAALNCGAEIAPPGEFTKRAFLTGRIDLTQAEAVIDIIRAKTEKSARAAVSQLGGGLSQRIGELRSLLADALAVALVNIDYPDDDKDHSDPDSAQSAITSALHAASLLADALIAASKTGRILREGFAVAIAGAANAGKSSLLNALLKESRAIVTALPGTTRDSIEEQADIRGIPVRLTDTAGIRETDSEIEKMGIDRARTVIADADMVIFLVDGSGDIDEDDVDAFKTVLHERRHTAERGCILMAISKSDMPQSVTEEDIEYLIRDAVGDVEDEEGELYTIHPEGEDKGSGELYTIHEGGVVNACIRVSSETGQGLSMVEDIIEKIVYGGGASRADETLITNARHKNLLEKTSGEIKAAIDRIAESGDIDLAETNIRSAYDYLGEITGETATDDILDRVFSRFCVGK